MLSINFSELFWGIFNFFLLLFLLNRFLYKPLIKFMDDRKARIDAGLDEEKKALEEEQANNDQVNNREGRSRGQGQPFSGHIRGAQRRGKNRARRA